MTPAAQRNQARQHPWRSVAKLNTAPEIPSSADLAGMPTSSHDSQISRLQPLPRPAIHVMPLKPKVTRTAAEPAPSPAAPLVVEPLEPNEPCTSVDGRFGSTLPARSGLSPSQRAARRRTQASRDSHAAYVTYTIDPR